MLNNYLDKTLEELEGETWGEPSMAQTLLLGVMNYEENR